jgi:iron(III) transport system substrate-binding protein
MKMKLMCILALVALMGPPVVIAHAEDFTAYEQELYDAAKKENGVTWYTSQNTTSQAEEISKMFSERYKGIKCNPVRAQGSATFQRALMEVQAKAVQGDVLSTNSLANFGELKKINGLIEYRPKNLVNLHKVLAPLNDADGYYFISGASPFGIVYNKGLIAEADLPKSWKDLTDSKWKDKLAIAHPGFSGSAGLWAMAMEKLYGLDYFKAIAKNNPQIGRSIIDGYRLVVSGERSLAVTAISLGGDAQRAGKPIGVIIPKEGMFLPPSATGILAGTKNPNTAKLFAEFLLSRQYSEWLARKGRIPLRSDVEASMGTPDLKTAKVLSVPISEALKGQAATVESFRNIFGI